MTDKRVVLTTTGSREEADKIARSLVERKLAACVNVVGPISSTYRWENKVETAEEFLLLIKTSGEIFEAVREAIEEMHSYDLPECVALVIDRGSEEYLEWIERSIE
jgi:periplasmic divalent cation tolerance protein